MQLKQREKAETLRILVNRCAPEKLVFIGGPGVAGEYDFPDYLRFDSTMSCRSPQSAEPSCARYPLPSSPSEESEDGETEAILSERYLDENPADFFAFYLDVLLSEDLHPTAVHRILKGLEQKGILSDIITENVDGLHMQAGSSIVHELCGNIQNNVCCDCKTIYRLDELRRAHVEAEDGIARCRCGGIIRPGIVLNGQDICQDALHEGKEAVSGADMLIVAGSTLSRYPVCELIESFAGTHLVQISRHTDARDKKATLRIKGGIEEVLRCL